MTKMIRIDRKRMRYLFSIRKSVNEFVSENVFIWYEYVRRMNESRLVKRIYKKVGVEKWWEE